MGWLTGAMRRYRGPIADSIRWQHFPLRDDDVIVTAPAKCGTTWMQTIVGMLLLQRVDLGAPMGLLSPWLDMRTRSTGELFELLAAQDHRRFIKTHTPLDGLPWRDLVTYIAVIRHPLDAALSNKDHDEIMSVDRVRELRQQAGTDGDGDDPAGFAKVEKPDDPATYLRWWIDNDRPATGSGITNLAELAHQAQTYWDARHRPNVHLFHYADLQADLDGEMRRVAAALGVAVEEASVIDQWDDLVHAASLDAMRGRANDLVPDAHLDMWSSVEGFFRRGGRRDWADLLGPADLAHYEQRLGELAGEGTVDWIERGRAAMC